MNTIQEFEQRKAAVLQEERPVLCAAAGEAGGPAIDAARLDAVARGIALHCAGR